MSLDHDTVMANAKDERPFSNHSEYEYWADSGRGCYDCIHDNPDVELYCPILGAALLGRWPAEWTRRVHHWEIGGKSGDYEVADECTGFERRPDGDDGPDVPEPGPQPVAVIDGQVDMFEVFADSIAETASEAVMVDAA